ncbi:MAG: CHASE domain-containing protein [Syntrophales bacterium]|nr:CHASE domain-containing protein [Syntrophales bacterium]
MQNENKIKENDMSPLRSYIPIICTFIIGVAVSLILFVIVKNWEQTNQRIEFESRSRGYSSAVQGNLNKYLEALSFLGDFFNNSQQVTRQEFTFFTESALSRHPAIQAFSWNPLIMGNERTMYESLARKEGLKNFRFTERTKEGALVDAAQRQEYVVVYYIVPLETNKPALGYDIASDATRLQAIEQVFKTGELTVTNRITLVQETGTQFGVLVFFPLYQQGVSLKTAEARLKYRRGLVVEVLRIGDVVEAALKDFPDEGINLCLYDVSAEKGKRLLYSRLSHMHGMTEQPMDEEVIQKDIHWSNNFEIAGRQWKILFTPSPFFLDSKQSWQSWLILSGSLLLTAILLFYLLKRLHYTTEIEWRVREQLQATQQLLNEITERKRAQEALQDSEERFRLFMDHFPGVAFIKDIEGHYVYANKGYEKRRNLKKEDWYGKTDEELWPPETVTQFKETDELVISEGRSVQTIDMVPDDQGEIRTQLTTKFPVLKDGRVSLVGGIGIDITDLKRAEEALQANKLQLSNALEIAHLGHWEYDVANDLFTFNDQFYKIFRTTAEKCGGYTMHSGEYAHRFVHPDDMDVVGEEIRKAIETTDPHFNRQIEHRMLYADGTVGYITVRFFIVKDSQGRTVKTYGVNQDITDRKLAEEKIKASLREKETMLKEIHHRVKNNLQVISSLLSLQSNYVQDEKSRKMFQESQDRVKIMATIHNMLYKSEDLAKVDFGGFIRDLASRLQQSYGSAESPIDIHADIADVFLLIETSVPCGLILNELVSNALRHAFPEGRGGEVNINMTTAGEQFVLTVQDNGIGFPKAVDFRNTQSLGLELVNLLVGQIDGAIDLQVEGGTTFTVTFPAAGK